MKAILTGKPADMCTRKVIKYINGIQFAFFLPSADSHRNAKCSCGSGKKYKRCCGKDDNNGGT